MVCRFADVNFDIQLRDARVGSRLRPYETDGAPDFCLRIEDEAFAEKFDSFGNRNVFMTEFLCISQAVSDALLKNYDGFLFHSSAISYEGSGILFSAVSGTGKSTHARFWKNLFGDKVVYVNDDKPFIREVGGEFFVYGNPWDGKERLSNNVKVPLKVICFIERGTQTTVRDMSVPNAVVSFYNQTFRAIEEDMQDKFLSLIDRLLRKVKIVKVTLPLDEKSPEKVLEAIGEYL